MNPPRRVACVMCALAVATASLSAAPAYAAPRGGASRAGRDAASKLSDVDSAERYYANMDFESANGIAQRALAQHGLSHDQIVRATRVLALTYATLGKEDQARDAFTSLLMMDPSYELDPNLSPRVTTPFIEARGYWRGQPSKPGLEVVATVHSSDSAKLVVTTRDPSHVVSNVNLAYRWGSNGPFTTRPVAIGDSVVVVVPAAPSSAETRLDYYVSGLDEHDSLIFEVGNLAAPKTAMVDAPAALAAPAPVVLAETPHGSGKSIFASPVFWTVVGVVVAGAAVSGFILFSPKAPNGATLTPGADCAGAPCR